MVEVGKVSAIVCETLCEELRSFRLGSARNSEVSGILHSSISGLPVNDNQVEKHMPPSGAAVYSRESHTMEKAQGNCGPVTRPVYR